MKRALSLMAWFLVIGGFLFGTPDLPQKPPDLQIPSTSYEQTGVSVWYVYHQTGSLALYGVAPDNTVAALIVLTKMKSGNLLHIHSQLVYPESAEYDYLINGETKQFEIEYEMNSEILLEYIESYQADLLGLYPDIFNDKGVWECRYLYAAMVAAISNPVAELGLAYACWRARCDGCGCSCGYHENCSNC